MPLPRLRSSPRSELTGAAAAADAAAGSQSDAVPPRRRATRRPTRKRSWPTIAAGRTLFDRAGSSAPNATTEERARFFPEARRHRARDLLCLLPAWRDSARIAASYASDADLSHEWENQAASAARAEAAFIGQPSPRDLPQPWLAPHLNLIAGHRKPCASRMEWSGDARAARGGDRRRAPATSPSARDAGAIR